MNTPTTHSPDAIDNHNQTSRRTGTHVSAEPTVSDIASDIGDTLTTYAKKRPEVVAMWSFGVGFVLAWKLKPW